MSADKLLFAIHEKADGTLELVIKLVQFLGSGLGSEVKSLFADFVLQLCQEHHLELLCHLQQELDLGVGSEVMNAVRGSFIGSRDPANQVRAEGRSLQWLEPQETEFFQIVSLQRR